MPNVTHLTNQSQFVQSNAAFNGTNISGTISSNGISLSVAAPGAGGGVAISAGTNSTSTGTVVFSNSNGLTFGMNTNGVVTASYNSTQFQTTGNYLTTARASNDAVGLNTALTAGPLAWTVNSSGISLNASNVAGTTSGFGGNLISGSMTHNTAGLNLSLNHPAWLTTAMQSNAVTLSNIRVSGGTTSNLLSALTLADSNGVSFGLNNGTITATVRTDYQSSNANYLTSQSNQAFSAQGGSSAFQTLSFANSNGITFSNSNGSVVASHNGLTTARASTDAIGLNTAQSNVTWTVNSSGLSLDGRGYAGTNSTFNGTNVSGSITLNSNGIRLDLSAPNAAAGNVTFSAGTTSSGLAAVTFSNSNGISFGLGTGADTGVITASHNGLTTARASNDAVGLNTAQSNVTWTVNSNGISFNGNGYAGTNTTFNGANVSGSMTVNSNGVNLSLSANVGGGVTPALSGSNGSFSYSTATFGNLNGLSFYTSNGSMVGSYTVPTQSVQPVAVSGSNGSFNFSTLSFGNLNGLSFYTSNGSIVGSYTDAGGAGGGIVISGGTNSQSTGTVNFSNSNGVSFGLNTNGVMTASIPLNATISSFVNMTGQATNTVTAGAFGVSTASLLLFPLMINQNLVFNHVKIGQSASFISTTNGGSQTITSRFGIYSNNAGTLSLISSNSLSFAASVSSVSMTVSMATATSTSGYGYNTITVTGTAQGQSLFGTAGTKVVGMQFGNNMTLTPGAYWFGLIQNQSTSSAAVGFNGSYIAHQIQAVASVGPFGSVSTAFTADSAYHLGARGYYTSTGSAGFSGTAIPNSLLFSGFNNSISGIPILTFMST